MATARFIATLRNAEYIKATVSHSVRRASIDRAVFHAQIWLIRTQRLEAYCGLTYDVWEVATVDEDGLVTVVQRGRVADATQAWLSSAGTKPRTDMVLKHKQSARLRTKSTRGESCNNQHERRTRSTRAHKTPRTINTENMTYSQRRMLEMRDAAKRANASQQLNGATQCQASQYGQQHEQ